ncbi:uncharacterized protein [Solanum lycopersicum]|uniref:uncharacterized protein n=1 Tax=Solanum lycopersicum TaxID=4081 RepID=UPI0037494DD8
MAKDFLAGVGGVPLRSAGFEGLKVKGNINDFKYPEQTNCMLFQKYFPGAVTMATLDNTAISIVDFLMVKDGRYQQFPWGQLSFSKLIGSLRRDFDVTVKERNVIPRMCNWRVVSEKAKFEMLMSTIFQENACSNIAPTAEEIEAFDLAQVEHAHSSSLPLVQPNEEDDFDNFYTKPPEQLLRTYSRVSDTSPPPPPKRRKKGIIQKKKVSEHNQPDQSNVSLIPDDDVHVSMSNLPPSSNVDDVHGSIPHVSPKSTADVHGSVPDVSPNLAADVHGSADSQNVNNINPHIEELKGHLKTYANTSTFQSDKQTSQQIPIDLSDMSGVAEDVVGFSGKNGEHQIVEDAGDVAVDGVGVSVNEGEQLVSDTPKDGDAHQSHQDLNEHIMEQDVDDNVQHNIPHESSISTTISPSTQAAIDALIKDLGKDPTNARPLYSYNPQNITSDSQLPTDIPIMEIAVKTDSVTPTHRNRMPSRRIQSPYCTFFGSSEKGKEKLKDMTRLHFPFEECCITDQVSAKLTEDYMNWLSRGLLKNHNNKNPLDDKYRSKSSSFEFMMMDFVVAFPMNKNWFYAMSQPNKCWSDEHGSIQIHNNPLLVHVTCKNCYDRYYMDDDDDSLTIQEHIDRASVLSVHERSIINIIKGFGIPAALPWHLVDEVYIPINCDQEFHWVLAIVELKNRVMRVFDSSISTRKKTIPHEIKMLSKMLPSYLLDSEFFEENERTKFSDCHAYKDNITGSILDPQVSFMIEFAQENPKQECGSLDCGLYVTAFAEYMSDQINISYADFSPDYLRQRYGALLWSYGSEKAKCGYVSDNDDPPKSRGIVIPPPEEDLVHIV